MKRFRLPAGGQPGAIPMHIVEAADVELAHMYGMLQAALVLHQQSGPFTAQQLLQLFPTQKALPVATAETTLQQLADLGYIEIEYLT